VAPLGVYIPLAFVCPSMNGSMGRDSPDSICSQCGVKVLPDEDVNTLSDLNQGLSCLCARTRAPAWRVYPISICVSLYERFRETLSAVSVA